MRTQLVEGLLADLLQNVRFFACVGNANNKIDCDRQGCNYLKNTRRTSTF